MNESGLLSKEEVMRILRIKDERTLLHKKNFKIIHDGDIDYLQKSELVEYIGTEFDEPFMDMIETQEYLGITENELLACIANKTIPFYSLALSKRGSKRLFKKSELELYKNEPYKFYLTHNSATQRMLFEWMKTLLIHCLKDEKIGNFLTSREYQVIEELLHGNSMEALSEKFVLPRGRVRMIYEKAKKRVNLHLFTNMKKITTEYDALVERNKVLEYTITELKGRIPPVGSGMTEQQWEIHNLLKTKVYDLDLSVRAMNVLSQCDIMDMAGIVSRNKSDFLTLRNFGKKSLAEIEELIKSKGLYFGMDVTKYGFAKRI